MSISSNSHALSFFPNSRAKKGRFLLRGIATGILSSTIGAGTASSIGVDGRSISAVSTATVDSLAASVSVIEVVSAVGSSTGAVFFAAGSSMLSLFAIFSAAGFLPRFVFVALVSSLTLLITSSFKSCAFLGLRPRFFFTSIVDTGISSISAYSISSSIYLILLSFSFVF